MKKIFERFRFLFFAENLFGLTLGLLLFLSLTFVCCNGVSYTKKEGTVALSEVEKTPVTRIVIIDGYEIIYDKTGFLKIDTEPNNWLKIIETSEKGILKNSVRPGEYATIIIEEYPSKADVPALPEPHTEHWPSAEEGE